MKKISEGKLILADKRVCEYDPTEFMLYVKSLMRDIKQNYSAVPGIRVNIGANRTTVRMDRELKQVSLEELKIIASEKEVTLEEIIAIFIKRKIPIIGYEGEQNEPKPRQKRNDKPKSKRRKSPKTEDKLIISGDTEHVP